MTAPSKRELEDRLDDLEQREGEGEEDTVLGIGGDPDKAGVMTEAEYREKYSEEEPSRSWRD